MRAVWGGLSVGPAPGRGLVEEFSDRLGESVAKEEFTFHFCGWWRPRELGRKDSGVCLGPTLADFGVGTGGVQRREKQLGRPVSCWGRAACGPMDIAGGMGMHHQEHASFSEWNLSAELDLHVVQTKHQDVRAPRVQISTCKSARLDGVLSAVAQCRDLWMNRLLIFEELQKGTRREPSGTCCRCSSVSLGWLYPGYNRENPARLWNVRRAIAEGCGCQFRAATSGLWSVHTSYRGGGAEDCEGVERLKQSPDNSWWKFISTVSILYVFKVLLHPRGIHCV